MSPSSINFRTVVKFFWRNDNAAQLVEFAVTLPLLVVFVVGIFDFSGAYTLKQKLTNVAATAARTAAADPASDLLAPSFPLPTSVINAFSVVDQYFAANNMNDCGITSTATPSALTWTFTANSNGCPPGGLTIVINRGYYFPSVAATTPAGNCTPAALTGQTAVIGTCVNISYAYQWKFGRAASLLGSSFALPTTITATAVAMNEH
ncbi:MAG TPA: TadE/TadG family type IV pilus assembly protein [Candidatus Acidoferrum sp.]|jgi:Flp pilus assembly protein TadG|nr:TadE/TadG family type IV pilus assembly protein [Candidatus Acidoferrum sp.]